MERCLSLLPRWLILPAMALISFTAAGQDYPHRPIRLVVPFAPGGGTDTLARLVGQKLGEQVGQQVVVDNRAGANGNIGMEIVARAAANGYTLGMGYIANLAINPALYAKLPYDPVKDYAPITQLTSSPNIVVVNAAVPVRALNELVALAKAKPGQLNYAAGGVGTIGHLAAELLKSVAGINVMPVFYKGAGQAVIDVLGGQVPILVGSISSVVQHIKGGRLRAIAVTGLQRTPAVPEVPTIAESGYPGFEAIGWFGVLAPAGTPRQIVSRLNAELVKAVTAPEIKERLANVGFDIVTGTPEQFAAYIKAERVKWDKLIKSAGIRAE